MPEPSFHPCFDTPVERRDTDSQKWQKYAGRDVLPMWVADMDFRSPEPVLEALRERVGHGVFGYARPTPQTIEAVLAWLDQRYGWSIDPEWLVWLPGLGVGLNLVCRAVGRPGDGVLTFTPIYPPFLLAPEWAGREVQQVPLAEKGHRYEIDWEALEAAVSPRSRLLLFCHPHNPVGRTWTRPDLERLAAFCARHDLVLCSDEVHCDLVLDNARHLPAACLDPQTAARTITLMAASKTFNLAGLAAAFAIIPDATLRRSFLQAARGVTSEVTPLGYTGTEAAFLHGESWRGDLLRYLRGNRDLVLAAIRNRLPGLTVYDPEATYLAWIKAELPGVDDPAAFFEAAGIGLSDGRYFGAPGFVRLNFGCPRSTLEEGLRRMERALHALAAPRPIS
ncbi:MAG: putative C-S lyase [Puniceicoccaceae bacterium]|nr:MAG: putative C-S lyase [Puniceicoccaceae bacterium]